MDCKVGGDIWVEFWVDVVFGRFGLFFFKGETKISYVAIAPRWD